MLQSMPAFSGRRVDVPRLPSSAEPAACAVRAEP